VNVIAFVLLIVAAVVFLAGDPFWSRWRRGSVAVGLFFLTVGLVVQFCTQNHSVHF
jgi:cytochrome c biogenesis factor